GLLRAAPVRFSALLGDRIVERLHPASGLFQLCSECFEGGAVVPLERHEPFQYFGREGRAGIDRRLFDETLQWISNLLSRFDSGGNCIITDGGKDGAHRAGSSMRGARRTSRSLKSMPRGGRAMRTRRPSRFQRQPHSCAAASPASSPSARTMTSRTSAGRTRGPKARHQEPGPTRWPEAFIAPAHSPHPASPSRTV